MREFLTGAVRAERGATLAEYALLIGLIAVACVAAVALFGANVLARLFEPAGAI
jgi:Flp pilus assembly pilin Flp